METSSAVKDNAFEEILKRLVKKQEQVERERETSVLNLRRQRQLAMAIASVYYYLNAALNLSEYWDLTLEEFETVEAELKSKAEKEEKKIRRKFLKFLGLRSAWGYYLEFGHFSVSKAPIHGKYQSWFSAQPWGSMYFVPSYHYHASSAIPPNYTQLFQQLFEKRYPNVETGKLEQEKQKTGD